MRREVRRQRTEVGERKDTGLFLTNLSTGETLNFFPHFLPAHRAALLEKLNQIYAKEKIRNSFRRGTAESKKL